MVNLLIIEKGGFLFFFFFNRKSCLFSFNFFFSAKIVVHLHPASSNKEPGPFQSSKYSYIKLSFKEHGQIEVRFVAHKPCTSDLWTCLYPLAVLVIIFHDLSMLTFEVELSQYILFEDKHYEPSGFYALVK